MPIPYRPGMAPGEGVLLPPSPNKIVAPEDRALIDRWNAREANKEASRISQLAEVERFKGALPFAPPGQGIMEMLSPKGDPVRDLPKGRYIRGPGNPLQGFGEALFGDPERVDHITGKKGIGYLPETYFSGEMLQEVRRNPEGALRRGLVNQIQLDAIMGKPQADVAGSKQPDADTDTGAGTAAASIAPPATVDPMDPKALRIKAMELVFGGGTPYGVRGLSAKNTMDELLASGDRQREIMKDSTAAYESMKSYRDLAAAEKLRQQEAKQAHQTRELFIHDHSLRDQQKIYDDFYGKDGSITKWEGSLDSVLKNITATSEIDPYGPFGFSSWGKVFNTVGAIAALGGQIGLAFAKTKGDVPNFAIPLIMKSIDASIASQEQAARTARGKGSDYANLGSQLLSLAPSKASARAGMTAIGLELAQAELNEIMARIPQGDARAKYLKNVKDELTLKQNDEQAKREKTYHTMMQEQLTAMENAGRAQQAADSSMTQRGVSAMNAIATLENVSKPPTTKPIWSKEDFSRVEKIGKFMSQNRQINMLMADLIHSNEGDYGSIENALTMSFGDFIAKFVDHPSTSSKAVLLNSLLKERAMTKAKMIETRISNEDRGFYMEIEGTLDEMALKNVYQRGMESEYAAREAYFKDLSAIRNGPDWDKYLIRFESDLAGNPAVMLDNYVKSVRNRTALGAGADLKRLDVGIVGIDFTKGKKDNWHINFNKEMNSSMDKGFASDFEAVRVNAEREAEETRRLQRESSTPSRASVTLPGQLPTPGENKPYVDERIGRYAAPLENMQVTSGYGPRKHPTLGVKKHHNGIDLAAKVGSRLVAPAGARVTHVGKSKVNGNFIKIIDSHGYEWAFLHLDSSSVKVGDIVLAGALLGKTGNTGRSSGPHLHIQIKDPKGNVIDPAPFFAQHMNR